jgi:Rps23 Pro-64 3,4-dihydroxylase Tpa1-like proline 4-hydroxylase
MNKNNSFLIESPYPRIVLFRNVIDNYKCIEIIERFEKSIHKKPGTIGYPPKIENSIKRTMDIPLSCPEFEDIDQLIYTTVQPLLSDYLGIMDSKYYMLLRSKNNTIQDTGYHIQKYEPGGFYQEHHDFFADLEKGIIRIVTFIIYLNTVPEEKGGRTLFSFPTNCAISPTQGTCMFFPATWDFLHQGETCLENKYIITGWFSLARAENNSTE